MGGGILDLVATGVQDVILIGTPEKTFFKTKYSKYTNFGMQKFRIDYNGLRTLRLSEESEFRFKIPKYADLLLDTYVVLNLPMIWSPIYPPQNSNEEWRGYEYQWIKNIGSQIIKEISITTGGQVIQKFSGSYIQHLINRDYSESKKTLFNEMTGNIPELFDPANVNHRQHMYPNAFFTNNTNGSYPSIEGRKLYIPIHSWFSSSSKRAFPLNSLYNNELHIIVKLRSISELFTVRDVEDTVNGYPRVAPNFNNPTMAFYRFLQPPPSMQLKDSDYDDKRILWNADVHLYSTYCFLSEDEGNLFKSRDQQYLIKTVHEHEFNDVVGSKKVKLVTNGLVSNWMFTLERNDIHLRNEWSNYTNWPYDYLPHNIKIAPQEGDYKYSNYDNSCYPFGIGPGMNPNNCETNMFITDIYNSENNKKILQQMGIIFNGEYRENLMDVGIYEYMEPFHKSKGSRDDGLYTYNFSLNSDTHDTQPSGAVNMSVINKVELELFTHTPLLNTDAKVFTVCDENGTVIGINKPSWILYNYTYTLRLFEEKYNILNFQSGNCNLMYSL
jgi:hypothetical protein